MSIPMLNGATAPLIGAGIRQRYAFAKVHQPERICKALVRNRRKRQATATAPGGLGHHGGTGRAGTTPFTYLRRERLHRKLR
jgi:hypothetical protein